jgi:hypothetical protein
MITHNEDIPAAVSETTKRGEKPGLHVGTGWNGLCGQSACWRPSKEG